jgi:integrase
LTAREVAAKNKPGLYADGGNLHLQVGPTGTKAWLFCYALNGRAREMGLGALHTVSLKEARDKAKRQRALLLEGIDPLEAKKAGRTALAVEKAKSITFAQCAEQYIESHSKDWKNAKHGAQWTATLKTYCGPVFGALPVQEVDTGLVVKALEKIWTKKPETASRVRARIENVLSFATVRAYRKGENPARWRGHLDHVLPKLDRRKRIIHHPALPYAEMNKFMLALRAEEGTPARALEFAILTAARTGEVIGARPTEFDLENSTWTVPADRMKSHREHRVPLSAPAVAVVREALKAGCDYVFPGRDKAEPLSNMAMLELMRRMRDGLTVHGFRSTFRDWAAETTAHPRDVCEAALAHVLGNQTEAAYQRGDLLKKRSKLMNDWSRYCDAPALPTKVVPIRAKREAS